MIKCRGISLPLQEILVDFGADVSYGEAEKKVSKHYGIDIGKTCIRNTTTKHAHRMLNQTENIKKHRPKKPHVKEIIAETDGVMVPIVFIDKTSDGDRRKGKKFGWCEGRLSLAYAKGSRDISYAATFGSPEKVGEQLADCVRAVGRGKDTLIHGVGDGALWIEEQFDITFGSDASYTIDFYHLSEYIAKAAACICPNDRDGWRRAKQKAIKEKNINDLLIELEKHINEESAEDHVCEAMICYQYITRRPNQFEYKKAIENDLPIGSGRIESGNRSVVQRRMKIPGAWWDKDNAEAMLNLRAIRASNLDKIYWDGYSSETSTYLN